MLLLGSFGDGSKYVYFIIERGAWRLACVVMIDVVVEELEMLVIADVLLLFRVFVFRIHPYHNHTKFHPERIIYHDHTT